MLIIIEKFSDNLITLDVYSYSDSEFQEVRDFFSEFNIPFTEKFLTKDKLSRRGYRFMIDPQNSKKLEDTLNISFKEGKLSFDYTGVPYRCRELTRNGDGKGCEDILADSYSKARIICSADIARKKGWFSSYPQEGQCEKTGWFKNLFK